MKLIQRIGYYLGGFSIGLVILAFFLSGKKTSCAYGPEARVIKNINSKPLQYSENALSQMDSISIKTILQNGNVDFSKSTPRKTPCAIYIIEGDLNNKRIEVSVQNCDSLVKIMSVIKR
ncbi:MAG: hypothetical protein ACON5F_06765 [Jejuia sp.]